MTTHHFKLQGATFTVEGESFDLTQYTYPCVVEPVQFDRSILDKTITITAKFEMSPEFWGIIVGWQLQYSLRQLHQNLGRYTRWPYTN